MNLEVEVGGKRQVLAPSRTYTVGRGSESDVVVADEAARVSRHHLSLSAVDGSWVAEDHSTRGSFIDGQPIQRVVLRDGVSIRLGDDADSPTLLVRLQQGSVPNATVVRPSQQSAAQAPAAAAPAAQVPPPVVPVAPAPERSPAAPPQQQPTGLGTVMLDDESLRLELDEAHYSFAPGQRVVVGRDSDCNVTTGDRLVSGKHCLFEHDGTTWTIRDLDSSRGTFIDGKRVTGTQPVAGVFWTSLGDAQAGSQMRVVTKGTFTPQKDRGPLLLAGAALAAVVFGGIALALLWPDGGEARIAELEEQIAAQQEQTGEQIAEAQAEAEAAILAANEAGGAGNSPEELRAARLSTAQIFVPDENGEIFGTGSGALVSEDGLILTNIHVVLPALEFERTGAPEFAGVDDPEWVGVAFPSSDGGPADQFFVAEQVAAHPAHDAALIRVVEGVEGVDFGDLPEPLSIGTSSDLRAGDEIAIVGYPGDAATDRVSISLTNFQSFQPCAGTQNDQFFGCLRDYDEGYLNMAGDSLAGGSSGGPILHDGEIVGIQLGITAFQQEIAVPIDLIIEELNVG